MADDLKAIAELGWKATTFDAGVSGAMRRMDGLKTHWDKIGNSLGGGIRGIANVIRSSFGALTSLPAMLGVGLGGGAMLAGFKNATDFAGSISDMSARTGIGARSLVVLKTALKDAGIEFGKLTPTISKMDAALVTAAQGGKNPFAKLGLDPKQLAEMEDRGAAFMTIAERLQGLSNHAQRTALTREIFGRGGADFQSFFGDSAALGRAARTTGAQGSLVANNASLDRISDILGHSEEKLRGFFLGVADGLSGILLPLLERLDGIDLVGRGREMARLIKEGAVYVVAGFTFAKDVALGPIVSGITSAFSFVMKVINYTQAGLERVSLMLQNKFADIYNIWAMIAGEEQMNKIPVPAMGELVKQYQKKSFGYEGFLGNTKSFDDTVKATREGMNQMQEEGRPAHKFVQAPKDIPWYLKGFGQSAMAASIFSTMGAGGLSRRDAMLSPGSGGIGMLSTFGASDGRVGSLLSNQERRNLRNLIASGDPSTRAARLSAAGFSPTEIAAGDAKRAKDFAKEMEKKRLGQGSDNQLLGSLVRNTGTMIDVHNETFGTKGTKDGAK